MSKVLLPGLMMFKHSLVIHKESEMFANHWLANRNIGLGLVCIKATLTWIIGLEPPDIAYRAHRDTHRAPCWHTSRPTRSTSRVVGWCCRCGWVAEILDTIDPKSPPVHESMLSFPLFPSDNACDKPPLPSLVCMSVAVYHPFGHIHTRYMFSANTQAAERRNLLLAELTCCRGQYNGLLGSALGGRARPVGDYGTICNQWRKEWVRVQ